MAGNDPGLQGCALTPIQGTLDVWSECRGGCPWW